MNSKNAVLHVTKCQGEPKLPTSANQKKSGCTYSTDCLWLEFPPTNQIVQHWKILGGGGERCLKIDMK